METENAFSLAALGPYLSAQNYSSIFVLVDENTHSHCLSSFHLAIDDAVEFEVLEVPAGEESKNIEICFQLWQAMIDLQADRNSCLICLGGGMITDLGGFVASTFKRGIDFIHVPTTVLAMVDASIGGKTGLNLDHLKNQVGTFSHPKLIVNDPIWLSTLPEDEVRSGFAEMIKHGLIASETYFSSCMNTGLDVSNIAQLIAESVRIKQHIVLEDPFEKGVRKTLNFGHTAGHAFEALSHANNEPQLHGDAIAWGMRVALELSVALTRFPADTNAQIQTFLLNRYSNHQCHYAAKELWEIMLTDKKNEGGKVQFVLLSAIAQPLINQTVTFEQFEKALENL